jgi:hypothetical protein
LLDLPLRPGEVRLVPQQPVVARVPLPGPQVVTRLCLVTMARLRRVMVLMVRKLTVQQRQVVRVRQVLVLLELLEVLSLESLQSYPR